MNEKITIVMAFFFLFHPCIANLLTVFSVPNLTTIVNKLSTTPSFQFPEGLYNNTY